MEHHSERRVRLTLHSEVPFAYQATLDVHLHEGCLNLDLHVTHLDEQANWYGLGLHPYFPRYPDTKLHAAARKVWLAEAGRLPSYEAEIPERWRFKTLGGLPDTVVDHAFNGWPAFQAQLARVPRLAEREMNLEAILGASADFVFGGWSYGFRQGQVTPEVLQRHGIASYVLSESCIRVGPRSQVALEDGLTDLRNLGRIFRIDAHAEQLAQGLERELKDLRERMQGVRQRPSVFVYDSGQDIPVTVGRYGMPQAMIEEAGGRNIFDDIPSNWPAGNWEDVVQRNPQWIVIIDYGQPHAQGKIDFLLAKPGTM